IYFHIVEEMMQSEPATEASTISKQQTKSATPRYAWGSVPAPKPESLNEVMSEQLVSHIQEEQESRCIEQMLKDEAMALSLQRQFDEVNNPNPNNAESGGASAEDATASVPTSGVQDETDSDHVLALKLQQEFDREYNKNLQASEKRINSSQKVRVTLANHRVGAEYGFEDDAAEDVDEDEDAEEEDWRMPSKPSAEAAPGSRRRNRGGGPGVDFRTKHDAELTGRRNADKLSEFGLGFREGDTSGLNVRLNNRVFNSLKQHAELSERRQARVHDKQERSTAESALDEKTRSVLFKLVNAGRFDSLGGIVATGKESVVLHAYCSDSATTPAGKPMPREVAIKVFKTTLNEFKARSDYVTGDSRVCKDKLKWQNPRKVMRVWCEKELLSLRRLQKLGLPCPKPLLLRGHVLAMSFIGESGCAAPRLKDCRLETIQWRSAWDQAAGYLHRLYNECRLVHADYSEYNLLWWRNTVWIIDVSQAVDHEHPRALDFLLRDCRTACSFFSRKGVPDVPEPEQLFNSITGLDIPGEGDEFVKRLADHVASRSDFEGDRVHLEHDIQRRQFQFDHFFVDRDAADAADEAENEDDEEEEAEGDDVDADEYDNY
ncbi:hypothetical protein BOX15_Mlig033865g1, partial [Macrostomum lignano]